VLVHAGGDDDGQSQNQIPGRSVVPADFAVRPRTALGREVGLPPPNAQARMTGIGGSVTVRIEVPSASRATSSRCLVFGDLLDLGERRLSIGGVPRRDLNQVSY
jgi:hypothetical protein